MLITPPEIYETQRKCLKVCYTHVKSLIIVSTRISGGEQ